MLYWDIELIVEYSGEEEPIVRQSIRALRLISDGSDEQVEADLAELVQEIMKAARIVIGVSDDSTQRISVRRVELDSDLTSVVAPE